MPTVIDSITGLSFYQPEYSGQPYSVPAFAQNQRLPMVDRAQDMALMAADHPAWTDRAQDPALVAADHRGFIISDIV